jgi:two-component system CheB/CheR fusion protein
VDALFPIVGLGASAGGLEAFTQLLAHLPPGTGMAFVLVQHLAPEHESMLVDLLSRTTKTPVTEVKDGMRVRPNEIYVIPPNASMTISNGVLKLSQRTASKVQYMPIDAFLSSLADDRKDKAIGVILSGTASDGTLGLQAIKAGGGITFAQDDKSAKFDSMPRHAVAAGCVDFVLPPDGIAEELARIGTHPYLTQTRIAAAEDLQIAADDDINRILGLVRSVTGDDLTHYKKSTIRRRLQRRMVLQKVDGLASYFRYLQENRSEIALLHQDMLINVTGFFRDPKSFLALEKTVFPSILKRRSSDNPARIWVPGCSTGEEAFSLVMCALEFLRKNKITTPLQLFATDISGAAIEKARVGMYPEGIAGDVSPERLHQFFNKVESGYQVKKSVRDMCIFAKQSIVKDPPFSRLDLISCRNLLIYLDSVLHKMVMPIFHYALRPDGFLLLGASENISGFSDLFKLIDRRNKIHSRNSTATRPPLRFAVNYPSGGSEVGTKGPEEGGVLDVHKEVNRLLLSKYTPAAVLINSDMEILQFHGQTGPYLEPAPGRPSLNLARMAREGLALELRTAVHRATKENAPFTKEFVQFKYNREYRYVTLEVLPIAGSGSRDRHFLVLFKDSVPPSTPSPKQSYSRNVARKESPLEREKEQLRRELEQSKTHLQAIIEEQDATNEELRSANEEILSSNEELQSTNEEMETAKEELQSSNEELTTLNEELQNRNVELDMANNDWVNLLSNVNIPFVMVGNDLIIRRFTPAAEKVLRIVAADIGRPITDLRPNIDVPDLGTLILEAIETVSMREREVKDHDGHWYTLRVRPYRTVDNKIEGSVLTLIDIHSLKTQVTSSRLYAEGIVQTLRDPLLVIDSQLRIKTANPAFYRMFHTYPDETENKFIYDLGNKNWNIPRLRKVLEEVLSKDKPLQNFEVEHDFPTIGRKIFVLNARRIRQETEDSQLILLSMADVTGHS